MNRTTLLPTPTLVHTKNLNTEHLYPGIEGVLSNHYREFWEISLAVLGKKIHPAQYPIDKKNIWLKFLIPHLSSFSVRRKQMPHVASWCFGYLYRKAWSRKYAYFYFLRIISQVLFLPSLSHFFSFFQPKEMLMSLVFVTTVEKSFIILGSLVKLTSLIFCVT